MKKFLPLMLWCFLSFMALSMVIPYLPYIVEGMHGGRFLASAIFSIFSLGSFIASPFWGRYSDRYGRRKMILLSSVLTCISYVWLGIAHNIVSLVLSRVFAGLCSGWSIIAFAYAADITDEKNRSHGMALLGISCGLGFAFGPLLQSLIMVRDVHDYFTPSMTAAFVNLVGLVIALLWLKEPTTNKSKIHQKKRESMWKQLNKEVVLLLLVYGGVYFTFTGFEGVFTIWGMEKFQLTASDIGMYLGVSGIVMILTQGAIRSLVKRFDERILVMISLFLLLVSIVSVPFLWSRGSLYGMMAVLSVAIGLHNPVMQAFISRAGNKKNVGSLMGFAQSVSSFARVIAPTIMGALYASYSTNSPFYLGMIITVLTVIAGYLCFYKYTNQDNRCF